MLISTELSLFVAEDIDEMSLQAALLIEKQCNEAIEKRNNFTLAISGGKTPISLFNLLATPEWIKRINWEKTTIYWVHEHCVSPESDESMYGIARKVLLSRVPVTRYYRIKGEDDPVVAAENYEALIRSHFDLLPNEIPRFDCIILGVSDEGGLASIHPGSGLEHETKRLVVDQYLFSSKSSRVTMTIPVMNNSRCCIFMASGKLKHHILNDALNLMQEPTLPAQMVRPSHGKLCWVIDSDAYNG